MDNLPTQSQIKAYFKIWRFHNKILANTLYPNVMWYLWNKKLDFKWKRIWSAS